jgi:cell volume regulation protein A
MLTELIVPYSSELVGKSLVQVSMPKTALVVLITRGDAYPLPGGDTILQGGDELLTLGSQTALEATGKLLSGARRGNGEE